MRTMVLFSILFCSLVLSAQYYPPCDSIQKNRNFTGFCREYLGRAMMAVKENESKTAVLVFYEKGKKSKEYPNQFLHPTDKIYKNDTLITLGEDRSYMDGFYTIKDKNGRVTENIYYRKGLITKHVTRYESILSKKQLGKTVHEIAEYDYSVYPFVKHYIYFTKPEVIKDNYYTIYRDSVWTTENTSELLSDTLTVFRGYRK